MRNLVTQLSRFGVVGTVGLVIDLTVFNLLRTTILAPEVLSEGPVLAKIASTSIAIAANWIGNRYWTFHREKRAHPVGEGLRFAIVSVAAMAIPLSCLWVSHYLLGLTTLLADNVSTNGVGLVLGMLFRFWLYRVWVFAPEGGRAGVAGLETVAPERDTSTSRTLVPERDTSTSRGTPPVEGHEVPSRNRRRLRAAEGSVGPAGFAPLHRVQAVAPVDDRGHPGE
ncbi:GtrA family protein [Homoserinimonas aerilata]|uniref:GtrA family protein n=1 Tax=Homoserinimonas aerilata TaxID=1162970 RepID=UPI00114D726E|nr:GtrA family protein [Homoserinimonas aerilata]